MIVNSAVCGTAAATFGKRSPGTWWPASSSLARRVLSVASLAPRVDVSLLAGVAVPAAADDLESLQERGLLVEAGAPGYYRLSPVLAGAVAGPGSAPAKRTRSGSTSRAGSRTTPGSRKPLSATPRERGTRHGRSSAAAGRPWSAAGAAARLIEVMRRHGTGGDPGLDAVLAEAWQAVGEWDAAIDLFSRVRAFDRDPKGCPPAWPGGTAGSSTCGASRGAAAATLAAAHDPAAAGRR